MRPATNRADILVIERAKLELERAITRLHRNFPPGTFCSRCSITNPVPLGRVGDAVVCYACRMERALENHSLIGEHLPPRAATNSNAHRVLDEVQRIMDVIRVPGARCSTLENIATYLTIRLSMLGTLEAVVAA